MRVTPLLLALLLAVVPGRAVRAATPAETARVNFFEKKIRPLLAQNCFTCHSADTNSKGGLRTDDRNGLVNGGNTGPAIVPGHPEKSLLLKRVELASAKTRMPLGGQLSPAQIADLRQWIADGAAWPAVRVPVSLGKPKPEYAKLRREHWAWQPLHAVPVPAVHDTAWPRCDIDSFLLASLETKGLKPVADADRAVLLRRLTFDLTGLPPTLEEMAAFEQSASRNPQAAIEHLVDRLLASPAYGERWGRHWLDVARYAESTGGSRNIPYPHAWRYRDWVLAAFQSDMPYDQFLREQIAGDLLPASSPRDRDQKLLATGFLALGVKDVNQRFKVRFTMDNIDEQIDAVSRSVLALTASCARCHDHKFDPIPTTDYYALAGIFHSTDNCAGVRNKMGGGGLDYYDTSMLLKVGTPKAPDPDAAKKLAKLKADLAQAKKAWDAIRGTPAGLAKGPDGQPTQRPYRLKFEKLQAELRTRTDIGASGLAAFGVREAKVIGDTEVRIRGEAEKIGPVVPRGFLSLVNVPDAPKIEPGHSGRLELAQWLTSPKNPLTPRVIVNRVWQHLFGAGLVTSVDNFGTTGDRPSHPELLNYLAAKFVRDGWSIKKLVRTLVLTRAYQLSAATTPTNRAVDPANRLVWRHSPRRLDAEEIRDATLAASGKLTLTRVVGSPAQDLKVTEMNNNGPEARRLADAALASTQRSVYLPLLRGLVPHSLEVFDFAEQGMVTGQRDSTTVATQALYLLNDTFVRRQALTLAQRLLRPDLADAGRIQLAYRLTLGRPATAKEIDRATAYLTSYEAEARSLPDKPAPPPKPKTEPIGPRDARTAAWMSFAQALLDSAEFRYIK